MMKRVIETAVFLLAKGQTYSVHEALLHGKMIFEDSLK